MRVRGLPEFGGSSRFRDSTTTTGAPGTGRREADQGGGSELDTAVDLFPGSGAVTAAVASYVLHEARAGRLRAAPAAEAQRLRRSARAANDRRVAVLAA